MASESKSIVITNLSPTTTEEILFETFKTFGFIRGNPVIDKKTRKIAFINFGDHSSARNAEIKMNNSKICGNVVKVKLQIPKASTIASASNDNENRTRYEKFTDCIYFLKGRCEKGTNCLYRHKNNETETVCRSWNSQNCRNENCIYRHPPLKTEPPVQIAHNAYSTLSPMAKSGRYKSCGSLNQMARIGERSKEVRTPIQVSRGDSPTPVVGNVVGVIIEGKQQRGIVKWMGIVKDFSKDDTIIGIELVNKVDAGSDGTFMSMRFFTCELGRGHFVKLDSVNIKVLSEISQDATSVLKKKYVCVQYLQNLCMAGDQCSFIHPPVHSTYAWCYKSLVDTKYTFVTTGLNELIEKAFCNPALDMFQKTTTFSVNFLNFHSSTYNNVTVQFKRFSTKSKVDIPTEDLATIWKWYWKDDSNNWCEYQVPDSATSDIIEKKYTKYLNDGSHERHVFQTVQFPYELNFSEMLQKNLYNQKKREVRCRPVFLNKSDDEFSVMNSHQASSVSNLPANWSSSLSSSGYELVDINANIKAKIIKNFDASMKSRMSYKIVSIKEVCNKEYYLKYACKKATMLESNPNLTEEQLWHGTDSKNIDYICHQNFDWRLCKRGAYGQGSYFAKNASYSHGYVNAVDNIYSMFLADVLVGSYTQGSPTYNRPPEKEKFKLYDCCVDNQSNPSIFVIFERDQCYPRYLVKYKRRF